MHGCKIQDLSTSISIVFKIDVIFQIIIFVLNESSLQPKIHKKLYRPGQANVQLSQSQSQFHNFSITQNLREIDFGDFRSAKSTILTH